jgi:chlorite dismutase
VESLSASVAGGRKPRGEAILAGSIAAATSAERWTIVESIRMSRPTPSVTVVPKPANHGAPGEPTLAPAPSREREPSTPLARQFVNFYFLRVDPAWRRLPEAEREVGKRQVVAACEDFERGGGILVPYSLVGVRGDVELMLWRIHTELEALQGHATALLKTSVGPYAQVPYSLLGMTRRSMYLDRIHPDHDEDRTHIVPGKYKYIFVYPFVKTRAWYMLPAEKRQELMDGHIRLGTTYPAVKLNTTYSFGLDDQEFVVAFETDRPDDFLDLVMQMRETEASSYTLRDTPTFTCIRSQSVRAMLDTVG